MISRCYEKWASEVGDVTAASRVGVGGALAKHDSSRVIVRMRYYVGHSIRFPLLLLTKSHN
jgi:hypothetical protein